jgi:hypothetical protein
MCCQNPIGTAFHVPEYSWKWQRRSMHGYTKRP